MHLRFNIKIRGFGLSLCVVHNDGTIAVPRVVEEVENGTALKQLCHKINFMVYQGMLPLCN